MSVINVEDVRVYLEPFRNNGHELYVHLIEKEELLLKTESQWWRNVWA